MKPQNFCRPSLEHKTAQLHTASNLSIEKENQSEEDPWATIPTTFTDAQKLNWSIKKDDWNV
jgi:hypothetical protein